MSDTTETRARVAGLHVLTQTLDAQRRVQPTMPPPEPTPSRSLRVEAGIAAFEEAEREREELRSALALAETDLRGTRAELDALRLANSQLLTDMERLQYQREEAVSRLAAFSAVFDACLTIMQKHRRVPEEPRGEEE